jgi:NAD(P)H-dependent FMN reductase
MLKLHVITAATRDGRLGPAVADWALAQARHHGAFELEAIDLREVNLPLLDEPQHPRFQKYEHAHTKAWSEIVARADAFLWVTPEYDYSAPASLINAVQYLSREWAYKAAAFVSYGGVSGGTRGVEMSRHVLTAVNVMPIPQAVNIPFFAQHLNPDTKVFDPGEVQAKAAATMLGELHKWAAALKPLRA